jgi:hypothetical protein
MDISFMIQIALIKCADLLITQNFTKTFNIIFA